MKKGHWLVRLIGIILIIFILTRIDLANVASAITKLNPWYLVLAILLNIPVVFLKSWRWQSLLKMQGISFPLRQAFPAYFSALYLGLATPGRLGDFARVLYLTDDKDTSFGEAFSSVLVDKLFDIYLLIIVGLYGLAAFSLIDGGMVLVVIFITIVLVLSALLFCRKAGMKLTKLASGTRVMRKLADRMDIFTEQYFSGLKMFATWKLFISCLFTLVAYAIYFGQCYLLALSLNLPLFFSYITTCIAITVLITMIPISIAGVGTRDATLIALFSLRGITSELSLSYSLLVLLTFYISAAVMGAVAWQIKPIPISEGRQSDKGSLE